MCGGRGEKRATSWRETGNGAPCLISSTLAELDSVQAPCKASLSSAEGELLEPRVAENLIV